MKADGEQYDTVIDVTATEIYEVQDLIDKALESYSEENKAGRVCISLNNQYFTSYKEDEDLSIPTDKGIESVTFVNGWGEGLVVMGCMGYDFNVFANGIPLIIDDGVCIGYEFGAYYDPEGYRIMDVSVYGGSRDKDVDSTSITVKDGGLIMGNLYGGGLNGDVNGDVDINIEGGCARVYGGGYVRYVKQSKTTPTLASDTADVKGKVTIRIASDKTFTAETPCGLLGNRYGKYIYDSGVYGGGRIRLSGADYDPGDTYTFSAQVKQGVTIDVNCPTASAKIFGGGDAQQQIEAPLHAKLNADVTSGVAITLGERIKVPEYYQAWNSGFRHSFQVFGGGVAENSAAANSDMTVSAQIHGDVTIDGSALAGAVTDGMAADDAKDGCNSIFGGGYASGSDTNANVNGNTSVTTSRKAPAFQADSAKSRRFVSAGVAGGGYAAAGGTANVTGDTRVHICRADGQSAEYTNAKNVIGGGVSTGGTANVNGDASIIIDDQVNFDGKYFQVGNYMEKPGVVGGGWAYYDNAHADVSGTVDVTVGNGETVGDANGNSYRIIGGGKLGITGNSISYSGSTASVGGDVNLTLDGTDNVEELFCGSFEGRSDVESVAVTLDDSFVQYLYDKDVGNESVVLNFLGENNLLFFGYLQGYTWDGPDHPKRYLLNIGDGTTPTYAHIYYLSCSYGDDYEIMDTHVHDNAVLAAQYDSGWSLFSNASDLIIDEGGRFQMLLDETLYGSLSGGGTITLPAGKKITVYSDASKGESFRGNIALDITGTPQPGSVVATTVKDATEGTFTSKDFVIEKEEKDGWYNWVIGKRHGAATVAMEDYLCGQDVSPVPESATNGTDRVTYQYKVKGAGDGTYSDHRPTVAGEYTVKAVFAENDAYGEVVAYDDFVVSHAEETVPGKDPTCAQPGLTEGMRCSGCGAVLTEQEEIGARGHDWAAWEITTEPTLETEGAAQRVCRNDNAHTEQVTLPVLTDTGVWTPGARVEPTEEAEGSQEYHSEYGAVTIAVPKLPSSDSPSKPSSGSSKPSHGGGDPPVQEPEVPEEEPFTDVSESDWFYQDVINAYRNGFMSGVGGQRFAPHMDITRGMFITVLYLMEGEPETEFVYSFDDVSADRYYAKAVAWGSEHGIIAGYSAEKYRPDQTITREQMAEIVYHYAGFKGYDMDAAAEISYTDGAAVSNYAKEAVKWVSAQQIMMGNPNHTFKPRNNTTRAQAASVFMRIWEGLQ